MFLSFKNYFLCAFLFATAIAIQSCSDDGDTPSPENPDIPGVFGKISLHSNFDGKYVIGNSSVTIYSEAAPQKGQKHRSSDNFSTKTLKQDDMRYMIVACPDGITFNINVDKIGTDEEWTYDVYNGAILDFRDSDKLYIADPEGATERFEVTFISLNPVNSAATFVSCPGRVRTGQSHRASVNFLMDKHHIRYRVITSDTNASFSINEDHTGTDETLVKNVMNGHMFNRPNREQTSYNETTEFHDLYIADPVNASGPFQVLLEPYVPEWMTPLDDNILISDISIPGTHDTGTYALESVNFGYSKCQSYNISEQLDFGIRYLDLRVDGEDLTHGGLPCNVNIQTVITSTIDFLKAHPGETVIYELSDEGHDMPIKFRDYIKNNDLTGYFYMDTHVPTLGEVRGKIVVIRRFSLTGELSGHDEEWGIDLSQDWPDDKIGSGTTHAGIKYYIQDRFFSGVTIEHNTLEKADIIYDTISHALKSNDLVINFSSISASVAHTPYMFMWGGNGVDPKICTGLTDRLTELSSKGKARVGWIIMDYPGRNGQDDYCHIVERIINTNYNLGDQPFPEGTLHHDGE